MTTLLAVDDSNTMRKVIEITFAGEPFETLLAASVDEAMGQLDSRQPSIALIDVSLGTPDGYELCERVKREHPEVKVLLLSSKQVPFDETRGAAVGADAHIDKPFETQALIDKVHALAAAVAVQPKAPAAVVAEPAPPPVAAPEPVRVSRPEPAPEPERFARPFQAAAESVEEEIPVYPSAKPEPLVASPRAQVAPVVASEPPLPAEEELPPVLSAPPAAVPAPVASASLNGMSSLADKLGPLGLTAEQIAGVLALSKEVVEQAVWEVVPTLAEALIKEEIARLTQD